MSYERPFTAEGSSEDDSKKKRKSSDKGETSASTKVVAQTEGADQKGKEKLTPAAANLAQLLAKRVEPQAEREKHPLEAPMADADKKPKSEEKPGEPVAERQSHAEESSNERSGAAAKPEGNAVEESAAEPADETNEEQVPASVEGARAEQPEADEVVEDSRLAEIQSDEKPEVASQLTAAHLEAALAEQQAAVPGSTEAEAAEADASFLEAVDKRIKEGVDLETATADAFPEVTGVEAPPLPDEQNQEAAAETEIEDQAAEHDAAAPPLEALDFSGRQVNDQEDPYAAPYAAGYAAGSAHGGWNGGAGGVTSGFAGGPGGPTGAPETGTSAGRWDRWKPADKAPRVEVSGVASGLFVGGVVGYLLGRRRGRIKTERRLEPIQRKLEKQVEALNNHLAIREAQVRKLVWERAAEKTVPVALAAETVHVAAPERAAQPAPAAERVQQPIPERKAETIRLSPEVKAKDLPLKQVLEISETIVVGSTTIRRVFETNLIEETGLRRIVDQHLSGGDVRQVLTEELMIKELSYERDPLMNPRQPEEGTSQASSGVTGGVAGLGGANPLLQQIPAAPSANPDNVAPTHTNQQQAISPALVLANIAALAVLAILLIVLLIVWLTR